jgi:hypothetical protein
MIAVIPRRNLPSILCFDFFLHLTKIAIKLKETSPFDIPLRSTSPVEVTVAKGENG